MSTQESSSVKGLLLGLFIAFCVFFVFLEVAIRVYTNTVTHYDIEMTKYANALKIDAGNELIGHMHKPNAQAYLMNVDVAINSDGLRDKNYPVPRNAQKRIVFLGDSLTFGWGVEEQDTFAHLLETAANRQQPTEILNFGIGNYNIEQELNLFIEKGLKYNPDHVVVFFFINDAEVTPKKSEWLFLNHIRSFSFIWSRLRGLRTDQTAHQSYQDYYADLYAADQPGWLTSQKVFLQLQKLCASKAIKLQVVMLPELHKLVDYPFAKEYQQVYSFLQKHGIDVLDLTPFFAKEQNPERLWVAPDDAHPNNIAQKLIADYAQNFILGE